MKSSASQLAARGYADASLTDKMKSLPMETLYEKIAAASPAERTAAIRLLFISLTDSTEKERFLDTLLTLLPGEKKLYTKIEICAALENGGCTAAEKMAPYLGKIGNNQHKNVPAAVSRKKSYPLPRDIIARSMARMYPAASETLRSVIQTGEHGALSEALDAFGSMVFYHTELCTDDNCARICKTMEKNKADELIIWKCTMCLSAFPLRQSSAVLQKLYHAHPHPVIRAEAARSLQLIRFRYC